MAYRTLGTLRSEITRRLGFGAAGASAGVISATIDSFLYNAQVQLYYQHDWVRLRAYRDKTLGVDQYLIDYPVDLNEERLQAVYANVSGIFVPVLPGIKPEDYTNQDINSWPQRYEKYEQIEIFPKSDAVYTIRIWGIKKLLPFSDDSDECTVDDNLVMLHALANAKAHYRQPDAQVYQGQPEGLLSKMKSKAWSISTFPADGADDPVMVKPVVA